MNTQQLSAGKVESIQSAFMQKVYGWMCLALTVTGFVALRASSSETLMNALMSNQLLFFGIFIAENWSGYLA